jgi:hypothetical protein
MLRIADRVMKAVADVTVGSVIVLVHIALAERDAARSLDDRQSFAREPWRNDPDARRGPSRRVGRSSPHAGTDIAQ